MRKTIDSTDCSWPEKLVVLRAADKMQASTTLYTVMETAKANGSYSEKYIRYLLTVLPEQFAKGPNPLPITCCRELKLYSVLSGVVWII